MRADKRDEAFIRFAKNVRNAFEEINEIFIRIDESVRELQERIDELEETVAEQPGAGDGSHDLGG